MKEVEGRVAFITGGASGMGLGMAKAFARHGMKVVIADVRPAALEEAMGHFRRTGEPVHPVSLDVTDRAAYARAADEAERKFGRIHVLINNAGVGPAGPMQSATFEDWDFCLGVNVGGVVNGLVTVLPRILAHGEDGHVVSTSSTGGFSAVGGAGLYCTSKFAVAGMMESLASDLKGTRVGASVFFPGPVTTNLAQSTQAVRPEHLKSTHAPPPRPRPPPAGSGAPLNFAEIFMDPLEVGERVLNGIRRGDLFIMTHPEFRAGLVARSDALVRALPEEPINVRRREALKVFGTLLYNPIYDSQHPVRPPEGFPAR
ncbi:MAG TPA: SDR family NAD(P)-dependent oxidoreductase [Steroidobacteraceae bacterium]|nr:SDR family NAD(P)-dependent oxidoreductase [Steroidobacteraceae bacterium]